MWGLTFYGKQFHDSIILRNGEVFDHKNSLTPPLFIEVPVPSQKSERSFIFVIEYRLCLCFHDIWILFWTGWIFFCFQLKNDWVIALHNGWYGHLTYCFSKLNYHLKLQKMTLRWLLLQPWYNRYHMRRLSIQ
jgi:hypothetical protein